MARFKVTLSMVAEQLDPEEGKDEGGSMVSVVNNISASGRHAIEKAIAMALVGLGDYAEELRQGLIESAAKPTKPLPRTGR